MEKKQARAAAEQEDHELALKLQKDELSKTGGGVSRISSLLKEEEKSISQSPYQAAPAIPSASPYASLYSSSSSSSPANRTTTNSSSSRAAVPPPAAAPGDLKKFSKSKGISSDQYFGRDEAEAEESRKNLAKYSNSTSISSDMLYGQDGRYGGGGSSTREADNLSGAGLDFDRLKDSVKGFFDEFR
jgi:hypothetical protein